MLKNRIIKTTIKIDGEDKVFLSEGGRKGESVSMRQDFMIKAFINIGNNGLHTAIIKLYNLTDATSKQIEKSSTLIRLEAGWEGKTGRLFEGRVSSITRTKPTVSSSDVVTSLYCVSGLEIIQKGAFSETVLNEQLPSFLSRFAKRIGLELVIDKNIQGNVDETAFDGDIMNILKNLSTEFKFSFYITETKLYIKDPSKIGGVKKYSPTDGLLDIPIVTEKGIDLKVFLDPQISPGDGFEISSKFARFEIGSLEFLDRIRGQQVKTFGRQINNNRYQGSYQAQEIVHQGSSHEDIWESVISSQGLYNARNIQNSQRLSIS